MAINKVREKRRKNNMDDKKTNMTFDDAEKDFKKKVFDIFSEKHSGIYRDKDGLIVVPVAKQKVVGNSDSDKNQG